MNDWAGSGAPNAAPQTDAYITIAEADELSLRVADVTAWAAASEAARSAALLQASDEIDTLQIAGMPYGDYASGIAGSQQRAFPRFVPTEPQRQALVAGVTWDADAAGAAVVPARVKFACFLQALEILRVPDRLNRLTDQQQGVAAQSAGGVSESYDLSRGQQVVCLAAMAQLRRYLLRSGRVV